MELPRVSLCLACSLDGRTATAPGKGPDFTSPADLARLFRLRAAADALLIGAGTVRAEQVLPLVRDKALADDREARGLPRHPAAVIVSARLDLPWEGRYFRYRKQRMLIMTTRADATARALMAARDLEPLETGDSFNLRQGLAELHRMGFHEVLAEGGGTLVAALLREDLVTRLYLTIAPVIIGGGTPALFEGPRLEHLARFTLISAETIGDELHTTYDRCTSPNPQSPCPVGAP